MNNNEYYVKEFRFEFCLKVMRVIWGNYILWNIILVLVRRMV